MNEYERTIDEKKKCHKLKSKDEEVLVASYGEKIKKSFKHKL